MGSDPVQALPSALVQLAELVRLLVRRPALLPLFPQLLSVLLLLPLPFLQQLSWLLLQLLLFLQPPSWLLLQLLPFLQLPS